MTAINHTNVDVKVPGVRVKLGESTLVMPPLSLNSLLLLGDRLSKFNGGANKESVELVRDVAYLSLKRNYPNISKEDLGEDIDLGNMHEIMQAAMDVSGLRRKAQEDEMGEVKPTDSQEVGNM